MAFRFFQIPVRDSSDAEGELNQFLQSHRIVSIDRRFVDQGADSFWALVVDFFVGPISLISAGQPTSRGKSKDYKDVLNADDFAVFAKLRELRKVIGQHEAIPVYTIFTNEQLAQMVQLRCASKGELEKVPGVGEGRIEKYGERFLDVLVSEWTMTNETGGEPV